MQISTNSVPKCVPKWSTNGKSSSNWATHVPDTNRSTGHCENEDVGKIMFSPLKEVISINRGFINSAVVLNALYNKATICLILAYFF